MRKRILTIMLSLFLILTAFCIRLSRYYAVSCNIYAENGIKGAITQNINSLLATELDNYFQDPLTDIKYNSDGSISDIEINTAQINTFANNTAIKIYQSVESLDTDFGIPLGNTLGFEYLSGMGPKLNVKVIPVGSVEYYIKSELLSSGINQTLHRIIVEFKSNIKCLAPFNKSEITITNSVVLSETLIVGKVPQLLFPSG